MKENGRLKNILVMTLRKLFSLKQKKNEQDKKYIENIPFMTRMKVKEMKKVVYK